MTPATEEAPPNRRGKKVIDHQTDDKIGFPSRLATGQGQHGKRRRIPQKRRHMKSHEIKAPPPQGITPPPRPDIRQIEQRCRGRGSAKTPNGRQHTPKGKITVQPVCRRPTRQPSQKTHNNNNNNNTTKRGLEWRALLRAGGFRDEGEGTRSSNSGRKTGRKAGREAGYSNHEACSSETSSRTASRITRGPQVWVASDDGRRELTSSSLCFRGATYLRFTEVALLFELRHKHH